MGSASPTLPCPARGEGCSDLPAPVVGGGTGSARDSALERDDVPRHLAGLQLLERSLQPLELDAAGDQAVELELALEVEVDQAWHVEPEPVRAHGRALDLLLLQELRSVQLDPGAD